MTSNRQAVGCKPVARRAGLRVLALCSAAYAAHALPTHAQEAPTPIRGNFGSVGLLDMPSARMAPDGELSFSTSYFRNTERFALGFQALPWLEASFRYSGLNNFDPAFSIYYDRSFSLKARLWDDAGLWPSVAIGVSDVVGTGVYASEYIVASKHVGDFDVTFGMGWGRLGSSGLFDNPLGLISDSFKTRRFFPNADPNAGATHFDQLFHGPTVGLFGGVVWNTPLDGLSLIAEYSSDRYVLEARRGTFVPQSQVNFGASYQITDTIQLGANWLYGTSFGANLSFLLDPFENAEQRIGPEAPPPQSRSHEQQLSALEHMVARRNGRTLYSASVSGAVQLVDTLWKPDGSVLDVSIQGQALTLMLSRGDVMQACRQAADLADIYRTQIATINVVSGAQSARCTPAQTSFAIVPVALQSPRLNVSQPIVIDATAPRAGDATTAIRLIRQHITEQRLVMQAIDFTGPIATLYYTNRNYFSEVDAIERLTIVMMNDAPSQIERFRFIPVLDGVPQREITVLRSPLERDLDQLGTIDLAANMKASSASLQNPALVSAERNAYPRFGWAIYPQFRQELFDPNSPLGVQLLAGASASVELLPGLALRGDVEFSLFDTFRTDRISDSLLPHVRTDFLQYFSKGKNGVADLELDYSFRLAPTLFVTARAGYLESMFAGAGGEVLWRPEGQRWALGADLYEVWQRKFDRLFGLNRYHVMTGHVFIEYASPWYDLNFAVRAGQYLAGDRGVTFEASRRFASGVEIGAFFTKTNVSAQLFGEGSFDKGITIRIPVGWAAPIHSQNEINMVLRPVQRDGGQRLLGDATLYGSTLRSSESELRLHGAE